MKGNMIILSALLLNGCATTNQQDSESAKRSPTTYREAYAVYPGIGGNGISKHLIRSHTTALVTRPVSSTSELCHRAWDHIWDTGRRLEIRLIRFPILNQDSIPEVNPATNGMDLVAWEKRLDRLSGHTSTTARVEFLMDGEAFYSSLEKAIDEARYSIDLQTYLFDNDDVARAMADRLRRRSEDIEVRVMYDGFGTYLSHKAQAESLPQSSVPIENIPRYLCRNSNIRLRVIPNTWLSGNHVKSMIFDRHVAFIGGMNLGREYRHEWHDMMIRLEGKAAMRLSKEFQTAWHLNGWGGDFSAFLQPRPEPAAQGDSGNVPVRFLYTLPSQAQIYRAQLEAIRRAQAYIYIENAYFADDRILYELCRARKRGVDVRVILPEVVNHKIMEYNNRVAVDTLLDSGVRVYMYPGMSHIKAAVYDGWICVGTANFDKLSLQINRELNLATSHPETVQQLLEVLFERDFRQSVEITEPPSLNLTDHFIELVADET